MEVEIPTIPTGFATVPIGGFFRTTNRRYRDFGLCVSIDGNQRAAIIFPESGPHRLQIGGLPTDVVHYPGARLRVAGEFSLEERGLGAVIRAPNGNSYIRVSDGSLGHYRTFDLQTGLQTPLVDDASCIYYDHWRVGLIVDTRFEQVFEWGNSPGQPT
jgi:hypothetical protein